MKKSLAAVLTLFTAVQTLAGGAVVSGGRITALADSKLRIQAALEATQNPSQFISAIEILENGTVKVSSISNDNQCRALIYQLMQKGGETGAPQYEAHSPERAICN